VLLRLPAAAGGAGGNMLDIIRENSGFISPGVTVTSSLNRPSVGQQAAQAAADAAMAAVGQDNQRIQVRSVELVRGYLKSNDVTDAVVSCVRFAVCRG
jgi:hypothetical protein